MELVLNYLFSNGDAHLKDFAILETPMGDHRLSPAYDLLNTQIHVEDEEFIGRPNAKESGSEKYFQPVPGACRESGIDS